MIEVRVPHSKYIPGFILSFDGRVLEYFGTGDEYKCYHIKHLAAYELKIKTGKKQHNLYLPGNPVFFLDEHLSQVEELLAAVNEAKASL